MKARSIIACGAFAQTGIVVLAMSAIAVGLLTAASCLVEGLCCALASERSE